MSLKIAEKFCWVDSGRSRLTLLQIRALIKPAKRKQIIDIVAAVRKKQNVPATVWCHTFSV